MEKEKKVSVPSGVYIGRRFILCFLIFSGFLIMNCQRSCLSVAIVAMTSKTRHWDGGQWHTKEIEFHWSSEKKGVYLGAFFYGYLVLQIPSGWFCMKVGGKAVLGLAILISSMINILLPEIVRFNEHLFFAARICQGLVLGVSLSCNLFLWSKWAPTKEKASLVSFSVAGLSAGMLTAYPISGLLCQYGFAGGWPSAFYVFGGCGIVWAGLWYMLVSDSPLTHPSISKQELALMDQLATTADADTERREKVPWGKIFTSIPVLGIIVANFAFDCSYYTLLVTMPLFLRDVHKFNVATTGLVSALPWLFMTIMTPLSGFVSDKLSAIFSVGLVRKLSYTIGAVGSGLFLVIGGYVESSHLTIIMMSIGVGFFGFGFSGFMVNPMDVAPKYAGIIIGVSNTIATIPGFAGPVLVGIMTKHGAAHEWLEVYYLLAGVCAAGALLFILMGSGRVQKWAQYEELGQLEESDQDKNSFDIITMKIDKQNEVKKGDNG